MAKHAALGFSASPWRFDTTLRHAATAAGATDEELLGEARKLLSRKGSEEEQEVARLCARLEKFEKLAAIGEGGERDNAEAMAAQARAKLEELGYSMSKK